MGTSTLAVDSGTTATWDSLAITVTGIKAQKTVISTTDIPVDNNQSAAAGDQLISNGDGTASFGSAQKAAFVHLISGGTAQNANSYVGSQVAAYTTRVDIGDGIEFEGGPTPRTFLLKAGKSYKLTWQGTSNANQASWRNATTDTNVFTLFVDGTSTIYDRWEAWVEIDPNQDEEYGFYFTGITGQSFGNPYTIIEEL